MYGFCSNALHSASLSFRILLLFRIKSQPGVAYESVVYKKKGLMLIFSLLNMKNDFAA